MQTIGKTIATPSRRPLWQVAGSVAAHLVLIVFLIHHARPWVAPYRLPGTAKGSQFVVTYLPGRPPAQTLSTKPKANPKLSAPQSLLSNNVPKQKDVAASPSPSSVASTAPDAATGEDALGTGDITIALPSYFPPPAPDLSSLPQGTKGDVILDIVIDTSGKISGMTMVSGLGHGVDQSVIATVERWTFHPALQNGRPVASEQELHFHYEKG